MALNIVMYMNLICGLAAELLFTGKFQRTRLTCDQNFRAICGECRNVNGNQVDGSSSFSFSFHLYFIIL